MLVGPDAQRFEIPAVLAVVLQGEFRPQFGSRGRFAVPQGDGALAANLRRRIVDQLGHIRDHVELQLARGPQRRDADVRIGIAERRFDVLLALLGILPSSQSARARYRGLSDFNSLQQRRLGLGAGIVQRRPGQIADGEVRDSSAPRSRRRSC